MSRTTFDLETSQQIGKNVPGLKGVLPVKVSAYL